MFGCASKCYRRRYCCLRYAGKRGGNNPPTLHSPQPHEGPALGSHSRDPQGHDTKIRLTPLCKLRGWRSARSARRARSARGARSTRGAQLYPKTEHPYPSPAGASGDTTKALDPPFSPPLPSQSLETLVSSTKAGDPCLPRKDRRSSPPSQSLETLVSPHN